MSRPLVAYCLFVNTSLGETDEQPSTILGIGGCDHRRRIYGDMVDLELSGYYVLEGVIGHSWQDYWGEYNEDWSFEFCRRASEEEIRTGALE